MKNKFLTNTTFSFSVGMMAALAVFHPSSVQGQTNSIANLVETPSKPSYAKEFNEALVLRSKSDWDGALAKITDVIQHDPGNMKYYVLRGDLYAKKRMFTESEQDFLTAQKLAPTDVTTKFDLAEIKLMQKKFDEARPGFRELEKDPDLGDISSYKVFLCDLFGGHEDVAYRQLNGMDNAQSGASFYYAHVAWALFHNKPEEARNWLDSAMRIFTRQKNYNYQSTLDEMGYLPLPPK